MNDLGEGLRQIVSVWSGKCLDVNKAGGNVDGANVRQWDYLGTGQTNQQWLLEPVNTETLLPVPSSQDAFYTYFQGSAPELAATPAEVKPVGVGPLADFGDTLRLQVKLNPFSGPVDIYLAISAPKISAELLLIRSNNTLVPLSWGIVPWRENNAQPVDVSLFGDIPVSSLPIGEYTFYVMVTPAGSMERYYLWKSQFIVLIGGILTGVAYEATGPTGADILLKINDQEGIGSAALYGTETASGPDLPLTGFSIETGEGALTGTLDDQERLVKLTLADVEVRFRYGSDDTCTSEVLNGGSIVYSGDCTDTSGSAAGAGESFSIRRDSANCEPRPRWEIGSGLPFFPSLNPHTYGFEVASAFLHDLRTDDLYQNLSVQLNGVMRSAGSEPSPQPVVRSSSLPSPQIPALLNMRHECEVNSEFIFYITNNDLYKRLNAQLGALMFLAGILASRDFDCMDPKCNQNAEKAVERIRRYMLRLMKLYSKVALVDYRGLCEAACTPNCGCCPEKSQKCNDYCIPSSGDCCGIAGWCEAGWDCCGDACMEEGSVCCGDYACGSTSFCHPLGGCCPMGSTACDVPSACCPQGTVCVENGCSGNSNSELPADDAMLGLLELERNLK